jgi:hypothetical protein
MESYIGVESGPDEELVVFSGEADLRAVEDTRFKLTMRKSSGS